MLTINHQSRLEKYKLPPKTFLSTMEIFRSVPDGALREIEQKMVEKKFKKHESIFLEGDPAESVWFIKEGHVKAVINSASGRCQTLCMVGPKSMFGACCCFGGGNYPCHTVAETDTTVVTFPMADFLNLMEKFSVISQAIVGQLSARLRQSKDMQTFDQETVEKRILHILINLTEQFGSTIPLTRREIAEMAGTTVESSIRTFSKLEDEGLVSGVRGKIILKNIQNLIDRMKEI